MTQREIARLCCKVIAIYALIRAIESAAVLGWILLGPSSSGITEWQTYVPVFFFFALPPVVLVAMSVFLWKNAGVVAAWISGHDLQDDPDEPDIKPTRANSHELQAVAFATLGLWAIINALPRLIDLGFRAMIPPSSSLAVEFGLLSASRLVAISLQLAIGVWLLFGSRGLVQLLYKLRNVGLDETERPS